TGPRGAAQRRALRAGRPAWRRALASDAADRTARHRHRRLLRRQPAGAESGGRAGEKEKAQAAAGRDAARRAGQCRAQGFEGRARHRPRGARLRGPGIASVIDRTTKLTRAMREIDAQAPKFVWPAPPYYDYQGGPPPKGEPCLLTFTDG